MRPRQSYGGVWTEEKLRRLKAYLSRYMTILRNYQLYETVYLDAFAGTGSIDQRKRANELPTDIEEGAQEFIKGSARVALEAEPPFDKYIFVERSAAKCHELERLKSEYPERAGRITIENADATEYVTRWCRETGWRKTRAVLFLDPFGMQVGWSLLQEVKMTKSIDLWLLVPLWIGANRLMTKDELPPEEWDNKLTQFFGNDEWKGKFYRPKLQPGLFDHGGEREKRIDHDALKDYFVERLNELFPGGVAKNPLVQRNSRNSPLFLLCFATANPSKSVQRAALNIAEWLLKE